MTDMKGASTDLILQTFGRIHRIGATTDDTNPTKACITDIYNPHKYPNYTITYLSIPTLPFP